MGIFPSEAFFWDGVLARNGQSWSRFNRSRVLPHAFRGYLNLPSAPSLEEVWKRNIIIVGSGPSSDVGYAPYPDVVLNLVLTDPIAGIYEQLFKKHKIYPPAFIFEVAGEDLSTFFANNNFDLCYSVNAVDHSIHPLTVLHEMMKVTKPCGWSVVELWENEANIEGGNGMHQWNFFVEDEVMMLESFKSKRQWNVNDAARSFGAGEVFSQRFEGCFLNGDCNHQENIRVRLSARKASNTDLACPKADFHSFSSDS